MSNSVEYTKKNSDGELSTKTVSNINENASDSDVALFVASLNSLSKDTLTAINRVEGESVPTVPATATISGGGDSDTNVINLQSGTADTRYNVKTGKGNDSIFNAGEHVSIFGSSGNDSINNVGEYVSIASMNDNDTVTNSGAYSRLVTGSGNDVVINTGEHVTIDAQTGNDTINNSGAYSEIYTRTDDDVVINSGDNVLISCYNGNDSIVNHGDNVTIKIDEGKAGIDTVVNYGHDVTILGADADDVIIDESGNAVIIYKDQT